MLVPSHSSSSNSLFKFCLQLTEEAFAFLDRLSQLQELKLGYLDVPPNLFELIPQNSIRRFSLYRCDKVSSMMQQLN